MLNIFPDSTFHGQRSHHAQFGLPTLNHWNHSYAFPRHLISEWRNCWWVVVPGVLFYVFFFSSVELTKPLHSMLNCAHVHAAEAARLCAFWKTWNAWRVMKKALFVPHLSPFPYINAGVARPNMKIGSLHWTTAGSFDKFPTRSRNGFPAVLMVSGWRHFPRVRLPPSAAAGRSVHTFGVPGKQLDAN